MKPDESLKWLNSSLMTSSMVFPLFIMLLKVAKNAAKKVNKWTVVWPNLCHRLGRNWNYSRLLKSVLSVSCSSRAARALTDNASLSELRNWLLLSRWTQCLSKGHPFWPLCARHCVGMENKMSDTHHLMSENQTNASWCSQSYSSHMEQQQAAYRSKMAHHLWNLRCAQRRKNWQCISGRSERWGACA